jgi:flavin-dependent dehydrogenase
VVGADGRFSFVAQAVGAREYSVVEPFHIAFYSYFRGVVPISPAMLEIIESEGAEGTIMLAPCDDDIWMIVLYAAQEELGAFRQRHSALLWERLRNEPTLTDRLAAAEMIVRARGRGDLRNFTRVAAGPGWALVGDAGQHKDPIFGQGIGDATRTAALLADYVERACCGEQDWSSSLAEFNAYRDFDLIPNFDWMIKGCPRGVDPGDFREFYGAIGDDRVLSERFVNIFSHGISAAELFSTASIERWKHVTTNQEMGSEYGDIGV